MAKQEGVFTNRAPMFNGTNYVFWKVRIKIHIQTLGANVWDVVEETYQRHSTMVTKDQKLEFTFNFKEMNAQLAGLHELDFVKVMDCTYAKSI